MSGRVRKGEKTMKYLEKRFKLREAGTGILPSSPYFFPFAFDEIFSCGKSVFDFVAVLFAFLVLPAERTDRAAVCSFQELGRPICRKWRRCPADSGS